MTHRNLKAVGLAACAVSFVIATVACSTPGASSAGAEAGSGATTISAPVTVAEVAKLGDTTLKVWADAGEKATLDHYVPAFEKKYPNVTVQVTVKGFDDLIKTVVNAFNSDTAPDVAQGNQGYAVDGALVQAGLVRPLDDVAAAYGWDKTFSAGALAPFRWDDTGRRFGAGKLYANSPVTQYVGVFYNKKTLAAAGITVPATWVEFEAALRTLKSAGHLPIMFGNAEKYPAIHLYGAVAGAYVAPGDTNAWVNGSAGASLSSDGNRRTAQTMVDWAERGYLPSGFNGISADDAAARFAKGQGAFFIAGDWNAATISKTAGAGDFGFIAPPAGASGKLVATGSLGLGWHISAKTKNLTAAVAFVAGLHAPDYAQSLADQGRVPVASTDVTVKDPLLADDIEVAGRLLADDGLTAYHDWTTDTMYDDFGARAQELLAGRLSPADFVTRLQANWSTFQSGRK